jgi:hypothetical protein
VLVRKNAAVMLPCFFYYFGNYEGPEELDITEIYCEYAEDESKEIKSIIARGLHEALVLTEKSGKDVYVFGDCFQTLIKFNEADL